MIDYIIFVIASWGGIRKKVLLNRKIGQQVTVLSRTYNYKPEIRKTICFGQGDYNNHTTLHYYIKE